MMKRNIHVVAVVAGLVWFAAPGAAEAQECSKAAVKREVAKGMRFMKGLLGQSQTVV